MVTDNTEFNRVIELINNGEKVIFLSGKAGTGKSTFLKNISNYTSKKIVKIAPTGIAAHHIGGTTIHSFFQIRPDVYVPNDKRLRTKAGNNNKDKSTIYDHFKFFKERVEVFEKMELLIIDEISMVRCDTIDVIDKILRVFRGVQDLPFGGVQILMVGDLFQLPPIASNTESSIINKFYKDKFFFNAKIFDRVPMELVELEKVYRQGTDAEFISLLNKIRDNSISQEEINRLNQKYNPTFNAGKDDGFITICTHNNSANLVNLTQLIQLTTPSHKFTAQISGIYDPNDFPAEYQLELKEGAQIMLIKNNNLKGYYNGQMGIITEIIDGQIVIQTLDERRLSVEVEVWKNVSYKWNSYTKKVEEYEIGTFTQYPLRLAWAITVHKSQGLTFDKVYADLGNAFDTGMVYVALSRCTNGKNLILKSLIDSGSIRVNNAVVSFLENYALKEISKKDEYIITLDWKSSISYNMFSKGRIDETGKYHIDSNWLFQKKIGDKIFKNFVDLSRIRPRKLNEKFQYAISEEINGVIKWVEYDDACQFRILDSFLSVNEDCIGRITSKQYFTLIRMHNSIHQKAMYILEGHMELSNQNYICLSKSDAENLNWINIGTSEHLDHKFKLALEHKDVKLAMETLNLMIQIDGVSWDSNLVIEALQKLQSTLPIRIKLTLEELYL